MAEKKQIKSTYGKYLADTSVIAQRKLYKLFKNKLRGKLLIPNAVIAELENLANKGQDAGFHGLEEVAKLHRLKSRVKLVFIGLRPTEHQIKYARSGEIDALIRELAYKHRATLITADLVQSKSALAYGIKVLFLKTRKKKQKKKFFLFKRKKKFNI
ncbi:MAG: PIN domain-containing protein [Candidatus Pacearchaeota archaeon]